MNIDYIGESGRDSIFDHYYGIGFGQGKEKYLKLRPVAHLTRRAEYEKSKSEFTRGNILFRKIGIPENKSQFRERKSYHAIPEGKSDVSGVNHITRSDLIPQDVLEVLDRRGHGRARRG